MIPQPNLAYGLSSTPCVLMYSLIKGIKMRDCSGAAAYPQHQVFLLVPISCATTSRQSPQSLAQEKLHLEMLGSEVSHLNFAHIFFPILFFFSPLSIHGGAKEVKDFDVSFGSTCWGERLVLALGLYAGCCSHSFLYENCLHLKKVWGEWLYIFGVCQESLTRCVCVCV